jgi:predicted dehydrogenase
MTDATRPRLGFAGAGWIGRSRLEAIAGTGVAEVAAVADPDAHARAEAADLAPIVTGSFDELLDAGLDGLVIASPTALHADQASAALRRGLAVFCQKPLGRTEPEVRELVELARDRDLLLGVDMSYRHTAAMRAVRDAVRSGRLGDVFAADLVFHNAYGPDKAWYRDPALAGGGCLMDLGVHLVDLCLWTLGRPRVVDVVSRLHPRDGQERYAVLLLDLESATVKIECSWSLHAGQDAVIGAAFHGERGGAAFENVGGSFYDFRAELRDGTTRDMLAEPPDSWFGRAAALWARRLAAGDRFDSEVASLVDVAAVIDRAYGR